MTLFEFYCKSKRKLSMLSWRLFFSHGFYSFGRKSLIHSPDSIEGMKKISIGNSCFIMKNAWLLAIDTKIEQNKPRLIIQNNVYIGRNSHIVAKEKVVIEDGVLIADKVYISDNLHNFDDVTIPIKLQPIISCGHTVIGSGSWLGENVAIIGCTIGRNCVVAANAVVTKDVPDYSVVAGVPAKVIKRYCFDNNEWVKV
ncbi:MAG: acyltransferase [Psychrobium sp.]